MAPRNLPTAAKALRREVPLPHRDDENREQARFNDEVAGAFRQIFNSPLVTHKLVDVQMAAAPTQTIVRHGLGRPMQGWLVVDTRTAATVKRVDPPTGESEDVSDHFWVEASVADNADQPTRLLVF